MESKLTKKIDNFCRLNFSNEIVKNPKSIFCSKIVIQNPLNYKKTYEKISLKNLKQELSSTRNKNQHPKMDKIAQVQKQSAQIKNCPQCKKTNLPTVESSPRLVIPDSVTKQIVYSKSSLNMKLHKSFSQQRQRDQTHRRYTMYEQKNTEFQKFQKFQKISISQKTRGINDLHSYQDNDSKDSSSLINEDSLSSIQIFSSRKLQNHQYSKPQIFQHTSIYIVPQISIEESYINLESTHKWQGFKSTISIQNKSGVHEQLDQSFIIYNHLKEKISLKPISSLL